jgi:hypothetical protein
MMARILVAGLIRSLRARARARDTWTCTIRAEKENAPTWADPTKPREIALRYEPPAPWYRTWWGITAIGVGTAAVVGTIVYFAVVSPPDKIGGDAVVNN